MSMDANIDANTNTAAAANTNGDEAGIGRMGGQDDMVSTQNTSNEADAHDTDGSNGCASGGAGNGGIAAKSSGMIRANSGGKEIARNDRSHTSPANNSGKGAIVNTDNEAFGVIDNGIGKGTTAGSPSFEGSDSTDINDASMPLGEDEIPSPSEEASQAHEQLLSQLSGLTPAAAKPHMSLPSHKQSRVASLLRELIINAMIGVGVGSFVFLVAEILDQPPIPITPLSVISLFVMSALIGELTLLFKLQIPYWAILLIHCPLTFGLVVCWLLTNRWYVMLSPQRFPGFAASFVGIYILIWLGVVLHGWLLTERMNATLRTRRERDDLDE